MRARSSSHSAFLLVSAVFGVLLLSSGLSVYAKSPSAPGQSTTPPSQQVLNPQVIRLPSVPNQTVKITNGSSGLKHIYHVMKDVTPKAPGNAFGTLNDGYCGAAPPCGNVTYHGGLVMHNAQIILDFWTGPDATCGYYPLGGCFDNPSVDPQSVNASDVKYEGLIIRYFNDLCSDQPMLSLYDQYVDSSNQGVGTCSLYKAVLDPRPFPELPLKDFSPSYDIANEALNVLNNLGLNANTNTIVLVFTPNGVGSCAASGDCFPTGSFCAYHYGGLTTTLGGVLNYANMPDAATAAGNGCGTGLPSPNNDPFADVVIVGASHEFAEAVSDPSDGGWFFMDGFHEIGDECSADYTGTNTGLDNSNVHLGPTGNPYRIQSEWSNVNGGCTLDLLGPPVSVSWSVSLDSSNNGAAKQPPVPFRVAFQEAGETSATSLALVSCCNTKTFFSATYTSLSYMGIIYGSGENWCFDSTCGDIQGQALSPPYTNTFSVFVYDLLDQNVSYTANGGPPLSAPRINYTTAPIDPGAIDNITSVSTPLTGATQTILASRGSSVSVPVSIPGAVDERWSASGATSWGISAPYIVSSSVDYYHQYQLGFSYALIGGGSPTAPTLQTTQAGSAVSSVLTQSSANYWVDSGTTWSVSPDQLAGSTSMERWLSTDTTGTASGPAQVTVDYHHQYRLNISGSPVSVTALFIRGQQGLYDSGSPVTVLFNYDSNVLANQSRTNAIGYTLDGAPSYVSREGTGTFSVGLKMNMPHVMSVDSVTQYYLATRGGSALTTSASSPTGDSWFDAGTALTATTDYTWGTTGGNTRQNLVSYTLDGKTTNVTRSGTGTFTTPQIVMSTYHALSFEPVTQYLLQFAFTDSSGSRPIIPSSFTISSHGTTQSFVEAQAWFDKGATVTVTGVAWEGEQVGITNSPSHSVSSPATVGAETRVYDAKVKVSDYLGIPVSGAGVVATLANGTQVSLTTGSDGTVDIGLIPLGAFTATVSNLGVSSQLSGNAATESLTQASVPVSGPFLGVIGVVALVVVGGVFLFRRRSASRHLPLPPPPPPS